MAIEYHIYRNDGAGGPVDYSTIVASVAGLSWSGSALATPSDTTFAIRAYDTATGQEDLNRMASARIALDGTGADVTARPRACIGPAARPSGAGSVLVEWVHVIGREARPTGFKLWATLGLSPDFSATPSLVVPYPSPSPSSGMARLVATIPGLTPGATYSIGVRAYNMAGDDGSTLSRSVIVPASAPLAAGAMTAATTMGKGHSPRAVKGSGG